MRRQQNNNIMFSSASSGSSSRPLPLKQRTSSLDKRRDYSHNTWWSLLVLLKVREYFVTVDNFSIWRRHLAWAMENGKDLRAYMTQRYGSSMVFMSLLLSTELSILFNSAPVTTKVREALREGHHATISFWAGLLIIISSLLTVLSLIALFTAWGMVNSIDERNAHCIFRSSIGQYAAELPGRLIVCSIYTFLISFMSFFFLLLPVGSWSIILSVLTTFLFIHIVSTFSAFGRVIMHTGAMGNARIFSPEFEEFLLPHTLHHNLLSKARANLANNTSIIRQYRRKQQPIDRHLTDENLYDHLSGNAPFDSTVIPENIAYRPRADSTVRFADMEEQANKSSPSSNAGGANDKNYGYSSYNHHRTLTPLSDSSSFREHDFLEEKPTPSSSLRKSSYGGPPRPRPSGQQYAQHRTSGVPPPPPPQSSSGFVSTPSRSSGNIGNVSTRSLEEWLSHPGTPMTMTSSPAVAGSSHRPASITSAARDEGRGSDYGSTASNFMSPSLSMAQRAGHTPMPDSTSTNAKDSSNYPAGRRSTVPASESTGARRRSPVPSTSMDQLKTVHSELSLDDRDLSEDERFTLDYGDIGEGDALLSPSNYNPNEQYPTMDEPSSLRQFSSGQSSEQGYYSDEEEDTTDGELRGLIHHSNRQMYSATVNSGSGDGTGTAASATRDKSSPPPPPQEDS